ncbi:MAG: hypothetical protein OXC28_20225 [Defluviicoccus sp.]|nr:hypothetical protein [Defluviicoccus sp.]
MTRAIHGAPAEALRRALKALSQLSFWIAWTADPDLAPTPHVSVRCIRDAAAALRNAADLLDQAADRAEADKRNESARAPGP